MNSMEYNLRNFKEFLQPQTYRVFKSVYLMMDELTLMNEKNEKFDIFKQGLAFARNAVSLMIDLIDEIAPNRDRYQVTDGTTYFRSCLEEAEELGLSPEIWQVYAEYAWVNSYLIEFDQEFTFNNDSYDNDIYDALDAVLAMVTKSFGYLKLDKLKNLENLNKISYN